MSCKINPEVRNKEGQLVESKLFMQLTSLTKDREMAKMLYAISKEPDFIKEHQQNPDSIISGDGRSILFNLFKYDFEPTKSDVVLTKLKNLVKQDSDLYKLIEQLSTLPLNVVFDEYFKGDQKDAYMFISGGKTIHISLEQAQQYSSSGFITGFLHEVVHGYTLREYNENIEFKAQIDALYEKAKKLSKQKDSYGFTEAEEFITEIYTNPEFREHIKTLEDNIWSIFVKLIRKILGKENYSIYNRSLSLIDNIINNTNEKVFQDQLNMSIEFSGDNWIKKSIKPTLELDENGEPTIESFSKIVGLDNLISDEANIAKFSKELDVNKYYENIDEVITKVIAFNATHSDYVASFDRIDAHFKIKVETKNADNAEVASALEKQVQVNNRLLAVLNSIGFTVTTDSTLTSVHGVFDPNNAETTAEGLKTVIRVANSLEGKQAISEETAHLMIEGLMNQPLVQRLLKQMNSTGVVEEILGTSFDRYMELYKGDQGLMKKEAAGKILSKYLKGEDLKTMDKYSNIIERLWESAKRLFRKISTQSMDVILKEANFNAKNLAAQIINGEIVSQVDTDSVLKADTLYQVNRATELLANTANKALFNKKKKLSIYLGRKKSKAYNEGDILEIKSLQKAIAEEDYYTGLAGFLNNAVKEITAANIRMNKLLSSHGATMEGTISEQMYAARTLRDIRDFISAYQEPINDILNLSHAAKREGLEGELDMEKIQQLESVALQISKVMRDLNADYKTTALSLVTNMLRPMLHGGENIVIPFGKKKGQEISVELLLKKADKDISFLNAWMDSASDSNDLLIALYDKAIKNAEAKVKEGYDDIEHSLNKAHTVLTKINGVKDTKFMFETVDGVPSGFYISDVDHAKFYKAKEKFYEELTSRNLSEDQMNREMRKWDKQNTYMSEVDPSIGRWERVPKAKLYPSTALSKLTPAQREYYDFFMKMKVDLDSKVPEQHTYKYKAVQIRKDVTETALTQIGSPKKAGKTLLSSITDGWVRREDDDEFGDAPIELDAQGNPIKTKLSALKGGGSKTIVSVDFNGKKVNKLPVYYTRMIDDMERLSTDATGTLLAYGYMATHFQEMGKIVDTLELGRDVMMSRKVGQHKGNKLMAESINILGEKLQEDYTKTGEDSEIMKRFNVLMEQNVYGIQKVDEGTWNVFGHEIDKAKTADNIGAITSFTTLGFNMFSGINNIIVGKYQMALEGIAGEHFNMKDIAIADKNYYAGIAEVMGELGSYRSTSKLGLITEKFNVFQDFERDAKHKDYYKNTTMRFFGKGGVFFMQSAGEHYMQTRTLLAYMNNYKLVDSSGKKVSLFEAFEVAKESQAGTIVDAKLVLKQGLKKADGTDFTEKDVADITYKVAKINQSMHGIYNNSDKSAIQRYALGRLAMIFRKWMMPHYNRRFKGAYYDVQMDQYKEGMYRSMNGFAIAIINELREGKFKWGTAWGTMSDTEKANIKRATTEMATFFALSLTLFLMGSWKDDETWAGRMAQYFLRRLHLEIGTSFWPPMLITDGMTIIQSPTAGMKTFENLISAAKFWNSWDTIESGKYKGHSVYYRDNIRSIPLFNNLKKLSEIGTEDYMFNMFNEYKHK